MQLRYDEGFIEAAAFLCASGRRKGVLCRHPTGHHSVLAAAPDPKQKPASHFSNRPKQSVLF